MGKFVLILILLLSIKPYAISQAASDPVLVSTDWLAGHLGDTSLVILHVAAIRADYTREHIPGARFLWNGWIAESNPELSTEVPDAEKLDTMLEGLGISNKSRIIIYHDLQDAAAAARAYITLDYLGMGNRASILNGGLETWKSEGKPVTKEIPSFDPGIFTARIKAGIFIDIDGVISGSESTLSKLVDARSKQSYSGGGAGTFRPGHIKGAVNISSSSVLDSSGRYLSTDSLQIIFKRNDINPGDEIIAYCYSGRSACPLYIAAKILGHQVRLYDGSFEEWSRKTELPVEGGKPEH